MTGKTFDPYLGDVIGSMHLKLGKLKGRRELLEQQLAEAEAKERKADHDTDNLLKARAIAQKVAEETQRKLEFRISNLVSMALASVFKDPYDFQLRFVQQRNKTEAEFIFSKGGNETNNILKSGGGGPADISSSSLMLAVWSIVRTRPLQLWDEPFKYLSLDLQEKWSETLKFLCNELKMQIIMVSHLPGLIAAADNVIEVKNVKGVSVIDESEP
jgi:DNA repair exonuclease SbcCD ATPase subunit